METALEATGRATAMTFYAQILAPLGADLGSLGDLVVQSAARGCADTKQDPLATEFTRLLQAEAK